MTGTVPRGAGAPIIVVKAGGDIASDAAQREGLCRNISALIERGCRVVVLHGGGPQVTALQERLGMVANKVGGRRITSAADLACVHQAICGEVNVALTAALQSHGVNAFGCHGASGGLIRAEKRPPRVVSGAGPEPVDFGEVGDVTTVNAPLLHQLLDLKLVPVVATLGLGPTGRTYNINADTTVVQLAKALGADALLLITRVGGVFRDIDDPSSRLETVTATEVRALIRDGVIVGGMIPKVEEAMTVFAKGVKAVSILSAADENAFCSAVFGEGSHGTKIVADLTAT